MYKSCMFCHKPLGTNEVLESFPVGRRLAFDAARGRLWVVCGKCERWNLTPLEERWEAVEECERLFRETRVRVSTDNIGLARHREGLVLVRIGTPLRPEFAAWRYGDQFGRRRQRMFLYGVGAVIVVGGLTVGATAVGISAAVMGGQLPNIINAVRNTRARVKLHPEGGQAIKLQRHDLLGTRLLPSDEDPGFRIQVRKKKWAPGWKEGTWYEGAEAHRLAAIILPKLNDAGGGKRTVRDAVKEIEVAGHPERFLTWVARDDRFHGSKGLPGYIDKMPKATRLALEMALHEEQERRALEGELWLLEKAWKEAEEIADISDRLLLPEGADDFLSEHRRESGQPKA